jgi:hypothetical protein
MLISLINHLYPAASVTLSSEAGLTLSTVTNITTASVPATILDSTEITSESQNVSTLGQKTDPRKTGETEARFEWEDMEVGRGLANYNSDEICKVKGVKRSGIRLFFA